MSAARLLLRINKTKILNKLIVKKKTFFWSKGFSKKKGAGEIRRSPWRGCSQSLVLPTSPSEGKSEARRRAWGLQLHLDEAIGSRAEDGS